jgi:hypothetical protein
LKSFRELFYIINNTGIQITSAEGFMKLVKINYRLFIILIISTLSPFPQSSVKLMNYNLLNNPGTDTTTRNPYFREFI